MTVAVDWAFGQEIDNASAQLVLVFLAWRARDGWSTVVTQEEIAQGTGQGARTVRRALEWLEDADLVGRERRFDERGNRAADRCVLCPDSPPAKMAAGQNDQRPNRPPAKMAASPDLQESTTGQNDHRSDWPHYKDSPTESLFPNPSPTGKGGAGGNQTSSPPKSSKAGDHPRFAEWYAAYPLHKERAAAVKAFAKAAAKASPDDLIAAAKRYHDDPQVRRGYIKNPATWLNKGCWLDEPAPGFAATGTDGRPEHGPLARVNEKWAPGQEIRL